MRLLTRDQLIKALGAAHNAIEKVIIDRDGMKVHYFNNYEAHDDIDVDLRTIKQKVQRYLYDELRILTPDQRSHVLRQTYSPDIPVEISMPIK